MTLLGMRDVVILHTRAHTHIDIIYTSLEYSINPGGNSRNFWYEVFAVNKVFIIVILIMC